MVFIYLTRPVFCLIVLFFILAGLYFTYLYIGQSFSLITASFFGQLIFWEIVIALYEKLKFSYISKEVESLFPRDA